MSKGRYDVCTYYVWHAINHYYCWLIQTGATALYCASEKGHVKIVKLLIQAGANLDIPDSVSQLMGVNNYYHYHSMYRMGPLFSIPHAIEGMWKSCDCLFKLVVIVSLMHKKRLLYTSHGCLLV